jgi:hypothetical protein
MERETITRSSTFHPSEKNGLYVCLCVCVCVCVTEVIGTSQEVDCFSGLEFRVLGFRV